MKKYLAIVAATTLLGLAACNRSPEGAALDGSENAMADNDEMRADNMDAMADSTSNAMASGMMENMADSVRAQDDAVADNADATDEEKK